MLPIRSERGSEVSHKETFQFTTQKGTGKTETTRYKIDGKEYASVAEIPPEEREKLRTMRDTMRRLFESGDAGDTGVLGSWTRSSARPRFRPRTPRPGSASLRRSRSRLCSIRPVASLRGRTRWFS